MSRKIEQDTETHMQIAALTMVYGAYDMLRRWYEHYGDLVGHENLYIVSHGNDFRHREIAPRASVIGLPRPDVENFEKTRNTALNALMRFLEQYYDAVLRSDADEFVFVDPAKHTSIGAAISATDADACFVVGFNVFAESDDLPVDPQQKVSEVRSLCAISDTYSKAVIARNGLFIGFHGARDKTRFEASRMAVLDGIYLAHLKFARTLEVDGTIAGETAYFSTEKARSKSVDLKRQELPEVDGDTALNDAFVHFTEGGLAPWRKRRPGVYVVPRKEMDATFRLPARFRGLF